MGKKKRKRREGQQAGRQQGGSESTAAAHARNRRRSSALEPERPMRDRSPDSKRFPIKKASGHHGRASRGFHSGQCVEASNLSRERGRPNNRSHLLPSFRFSSSSSLLPPTCFPPNLRLSARAPVLSSTLAAACVRTCGHMASGGDKCGGEPAAGGDLYAVLGLNKECSDADLKVAYRKLAMKWHPDRCSSSSSTKHMEEAKEKFQQIQGAYSVLSDANKRFLYDVGVYEEEEEDDESLQGMGDFLGEMAHMMNQTRPTRQESFEELQQLFVDMFQSDLDSGFCNGPAKDQYDPFQRQTRTSSTSPSSSPSPPPPLATEAEAPSCNGINKRGSSAMGSGKPPRAGDTGAGHGQPEFCFGMSDAKQAPNARGGNAGRRRNGQKQKMSSKHDVSSEDEMPSPQYTVS